MKTMSCVALAIVLLFVLQRDMATGERAAIENAWMVMASSVVACLRRLRETG